MVHPLARGRNIAPGRLTVNRGCPVANVRFDNRDAISGLTPLAPVSTRFRVEGATPRVIDL